MPTKKKAQTIEQTQERYSRARGVIFTEYRGLKVKQLQQLRKDLRAKGGEIQVVKNTLFKRAAGEDGDRLPDSLNSGPTAITFVYENEADVAKSLTDFAVTNKALVIKGGMFGGKVFSDKDVVELSKLPSKEILIAQVIGAIAAPLSNLVGTIEALYADPIRVIGAVADKVAEGGGPVATSETPAADEAAPTAEETAPQE